MNNMFHFVALSFSSNVALYACIFQVVCVFFVSSLVTVLLFLQNCSKKPVGAAMLLHIRLHECILCCGRGTEPTSNYPVLILDDLLFID
jgi:hypothetical protein